MRSLPLLIMWALFALLVFDGGEFAWSVDNGVSPDWIRKAAAEAVAAARRGEAVEPRVKYAKPGALSAELTLNKQTYDIGEPIIATLTIRNVSGRDAEIATGGDYRTGRAERFKITVIDARGAALPDPLACWLQSNGIGGGLGSGATIKRGDAWRLPVLVNLFALPRTPGRHLISGSWAYGDNGYDPKSPQRVTWPAAAFTLSARHSEMTPEQFRGLLSAHGLDGIHPCLLYGLRGEGGRIPELVEYALKVLNAKPGKSNVKNVGLFDAIKALALMPGKAPIFRALGGEMARREAQGRKWGQQDDFVWLFRSLASPADIPALENLLDADVETLRNVAFLSALSVGSERAMERLAAALNSSDTFLAGDALNAAHLYLRRTSGEPGAGIADIRSDLVPRCGAALLEGLRREERILPSAEYPDNFQFAYLLILELTPSGLEQALSICENGSGVKRLAALHYYYHQGFPPSRTPLNREAIQRHLPFVRRSLRERSDSVGRRLAILVLGRWGDRELLAEIRVALDDQDKKVQQAAAEALFLLRDPASLERAIGLLAEAAHPGSSNNNIQAVARQIGVKSPERLFQGDFIQTRINPVIFGSGPAKDQAMKYWRAYCREILRLLSTA